MRLENLQLPKYYKLVIIPPNEFRYEWKIVVVSIVSEEILFSGNPRVFKKRQMQALMRRATSIEKFFNIGGEE